MKVNFKMTSSHFEYLIKQSYSLDHIFMLKLVEANIDIQPILDGSMKISGFYQSLVRKGLISDDQITQLGREVLSFCDSEMKDGIKKLKVKSSDFDNWWNIFPSTDHFEYKGRKFSGSRGLKRSREDCRIKFNKILSEGDYTSQNIMDATNLDVFLKKEASIKSGENKLSFMQNSLTYLNQRSYEPFIEMINSGMKAPDQKEQSKFKGRDI